MGTSASIYLDDESAPTVLMIRGGIKIEIDERRINQYQSEDQLDWLFDWQPEYIGEHIRSDLINLIGALRQIQLGEVDQYESVRADIEATTAYFLLEPLSENHIRLAFREANQEEKTYIPGVVSARGFIVETETFSNEILNCGRDFVEQALQLGFDERDSLIESFIEILDEFESVL